MFAIALLAAAAAFTGLVATQVVTQDVSLRASWQQPHKQQQTHKQQEGVPSFGAPTSSGNSRSSSSGSSAKTRPPTERVPARASREAAAATLASSSSVGGTNSGPPTVHVPSRARSEAAAVTLASNKVGGGAQRRPPTLLVPPRARSEAAALTIASQSVGTSTPRRHPTLPAPFRATSEATAATTTSTPSVTGSSSSSSSRIQDSAARHPPPVLRPDYAARVTEALASVKEWAQLNPPREVTAALADFLGVQDVHEWPKGGFLPGYSALSCCSAQLVLLLTSRLYVHPPPLSTSHANPCWKSVREGTEVLCLPRYCTPPAASHAHT